MKINDLNIQIGKSLSDKAVSKKLPDFDLLGRTFPNAFETKIELKGNRVYCTGIWEDTWVKHPFVCYSG